MTSIAKAEKAGRKSVHKGKVYYFFSDENKATFDRDPDKYASEAEKR